MSMNNSETQNHRIAKMIFAPVYVSCKSGKERQNKRGIETSDRVAKKL